jgi:hypothetical protein
LTGEDVELPNGVDGPATGAPGRVRRTVGAAALGAGAVLAVVGSLLPLYEQVVTFASEEARYSLTLWGVESSVEVRGGTSTLFGVPVAVAAALLAVSAVLVLAGPRLPSRFAGPTGVGALASAALLTGSVWTVGQLVLVATADQDGAVRPTAGAGTGALVLACVLALAGGVLVQGRPEGAAAAPEPEPGGAVVYRLPDEDEDTDDDTPPLGIPVAPEDIRDGGA